MIWQPDLIDMRDREGIVQVFFDPDRADALKAFGLLNPRNILHSGYGHCARDAKTSMRDMATGEIEVLASSHYHHQTQTTAAGRCQPRYHRRASQVPLSDLRRPNGAAPENSRQNYQPGSAVLWTITVS